MSDKIKVDTSKLIEFGEFLSNSSVTLDELLGTLNEKMGNITEGWKDEDGETFKTFFSDFIKDAKDISSDVNALGMHATDMGSEYERITVESLRMMSEGD